MSDSLHFRPNPQQAFQIRADQYWKQYQQLPASGSLGMNWLDARGNPQSLEAVPQSLFVQVVADVDTGDITDSNGYYLVQQLNAGFGSFGTQTVSMLRLDATSTLKEGDNVQAIFYGSTFDSPDSADDGYLVVKEILAAGDTAPPLQWIHVNESLKCCNRTAYNGLKTTPGTCGIFGDSMTKIGTSGCQMIITVTTEGDGSTDQVWTLTWTQTPTAGEWNIKIDATNYGPFSWDITGDDLQSGLTDANVTVTLTDGVYTITSTTFGPRDMVPGDFSTMEPLPQNVMYEVNGFNLRCDQGSGDQGFYAVIVTEAGGAADIGIVKTAAVSGGDSPSGVIWVLTESHVFGGTFTIKLDGDDDTETDPIRFDVTAANLETALNTAFDPVTVTVTGDAKGPYTITVTSDTDDHDITIDKSGLFNDHCWFVFVPPFKVLSVVTDVSCSDGQLQITKTKVFVATCDGDYPV